MFLKNLPCSFVGTRPQEDKDGSREAVGRLSQSSRREMVMTWARIIPRNDSAEGKGGDAGEREQIS